MSRLIKIKSWSYCLKRLFCGSHCFMISIYDVASKFKNIGVQKAVAIKVTPKCKNHQVLLSLRKKKGNNLNIYLADLQIKSSILPMNP